MSSEASRFSKKLAHLNKHKPLTVHSFHPSGEPEWRPAPGLRTRLAWCWPPIPGASHLHDRRYHRSSHHCSTRIGDHLHDLADDRALGLRGPRQRGSSSSRRPMCGERARRIRLRGPAMTRRAKDLVQDFSRRCFSSSPALLDLLIARVWEGRFGRWAMRSMAKN